VFAVGFCVPFLNFVLFVVLFVRILCILVLEICILSNCLFTVYSMIICHKVKVSRTVTRLEKIRLETSGMLNSRFSKKP